ncbi:MAG: membrane protein insertase YidC, partial [Alphaproteobacteria bacterium]
MNMLPPTNTDNNDMRNLIVAVILSALIFIGFEFYNARNQPAEFPVGTSENVSTANPLAPEALPIQPTIGTTAQAPVPQVAVAAQEVALTTSTLHGKISSRGARLGSLHLPAFGPNGGVEWLVAEGEKPHYADFGWLGNGVVVPAPDSIWQVAETSNTTSSAAFVWNNGQGQTFTRTYTPTGAYTVEVVDTMANTAANAVGVQHYAQVIRGGGHLPKESSSWVHFFGPQGISNNIMTEVSYADLPTEPVMTEGQGGWWGISSHYFLTALLPPVAENTTRRLTSTSLNNVQLTSAVVQRQPTIVAGGQSYSVSNTLYMGPKEMAALKAVGHDLDRAVDYGWFAVIAKPMHTAMVWLEKYLGNWGLAIIALTIVVKLIMLPLTHKSMVAMAKLKQLQPEMKALQDKYKDSQAKENMAVEMMSLYKKHKVSPVSGCWPVMLQMPVFFAMYKVMLVSFEFRAAPFYGWITDLSAQDPFYVLPVLMGVSMWVQMRQSPSTGDPVQQQVMQIMPVVMTVMFLFFPSGLVLYWL